MMMPQDFQPLLAAVQDGDVRFAGMRDPDPFSLERRILVVEPPGMVELTGIGDVRVLEHLVELLDVPGRAWAAQVALTAMTRRDEKLVEANQSTPEQWLSGPIGRGALARWRQWLDEHRDTLTWDADARLFRQ